MKPNNLYFLVSKIKIHSLKMSKKRDFENPKVINCDFSTKLAPNSTVFSIVRFLGGAKTVLSGNPLYINLNFSSFLTEGPAQATGVKQSYVLDEILYSLIFTYRTRATITRS